MHGFFTPCLIYGVVEEKQDHVLHQDMLDKYKMDKYADDIIRYYACGFIYGIEVTIQEMKTGTFANKELVDAFCKDLAMGTPTFHLGIRGDYAIEHETY